MLVTADLLTKICHCLVVLGYTDMSLRQEN